VLDALCGYPGWNVAIFYEAGILLHYPVGRPLYDRVKVGTLWLALDAGEAGVVDKDGRPVPLPAGSILSRAGRSLQAQQGGRLVGPVYLDPRLVVPQTLAPLIPRSAAAADKPGPKPGVSGKKRVVELANEILADANARPAPAHGWRAKLARLIRAQLAAEGSTYELESVKRTLRNLKIKHPEETG
jgi:hypothetical protein